MPGNVVLRSFFLFASAHQALSLSLRRTADLGPLTPLEKEHFDHHVHSWWLDFLHDRPVDALAWGYPIDKNCGSAEYWSRSPEELKILRDPSFHAVAAALDRDERILYVLEAYFNATITGEQAVILKTLRRKVAEMRTEHENSDWRLPFGILGCKLGVNGCQVKVATVIQNFRLNSAYSNPWNY